MILVTALGWLLAWLLAMDRLIPVGLLVGIVVARFVPKGGQCRTG